MQIALRSYLTLGTAAVVAAGAIGLAPVAQQVWVAELPTPAIAEVALAGTSLPFDLPFDLNVNTLLAFVQGLTFSGGLVAGIVGGLVSAVGPEFVMQALPLVAAAIGDVAGQFGEALTGLAIGPESLLAQVGEIVAHVPAVVFSAIGSLGAGDAQAALQTLNDGLAVPAAEVGQVLAAVAAEFQSFATARFTEVLAALPLVFRSAFKTAIGFDPQPLIDEAVAALSNLFAGALPVASVPESVTPAVAAEPAVRDTAGDVPGVVTAPVQAPDQVVAPAAAVAADQPADRDDVPKELDVAVPQEVTPEDETPLARSRGADRPSVVADEGAGAPGDEARAPRQSRAAASR
ncbi:hypothetical protein [Mycolicibacterium sp.]|uniref:hypothetical protein n=1 Tax=Mycolicibacterium sp. TaxID=2320850 RepID=UPI0028B1B94B|nr:hypothetical protein [Mycolicibacterium sp.]